MIGILTRQRFFLALDVDLATGNVGFVLGQYSNDYETRRRLIGESDETIQLQQHVLQKEAVCYSW